MEFLKDPSVVLGIAVGLLAVICGTIVYVSESKGGDSDDPDTSGFEGADDDKYPAGPLHIFFGSQTGTSEGFARILEEEGRARGFDAQMVDLEDFEPSTMVSIKRALFLMATYGEGEPTDNATKFYRWIKPEKDEMEYACLLYTSPSPRDQRGSRMPSSA